MNKLESLLGFASKAGRIVAGTAGVESAIRNRRVYLVICAEDLSPKTIKNFKYLCEINKIDFFRYGLRSELGRLVGARERGIIGIKSYRFAAAIRPLFYDRGD